MADAERLFAWRNDPLTRAMSRNPEPIEWVDHLAWLEASIAEPSRDLRIAERNGIPVATFRYDHGAETEFSITMAPEWRCRGRVPLHAIRLALSLTEGCVAYVKRENLACQRLIYACGMRLAIGGPIQRWLYGRAHSISTENCTSSVL